MLSRPGNASKAAPAPQNQEKKTLLKKTSSKKSNGPVKLFHSVYQEYVSSFDSICSGVNTGTADIPTPSPPVSENISTAPASSSMLKGHHVKSKSSKGKKKN